MKNTRKEERIEHPNQKINLPMITSAKNYTRKKKKGKMDRKTPRTNVKAKLYRQNHRKMHTHTHSQKEKKEKIYLSIYIYKKEESNQINKQIYQ